MNRTFYFAGSEGAQLRNMKIVKSEDRTVYYVGPEGAQLQLSIVEHYGSKFRVEVLICSEDPKGEKPHWRWRSLLLKSLGGLDNRVAMFELALNMFNSGRMSAIPYEKLYAKHLESKGACISWITEFDVYLTELYKYPIYH